MTRYPLPDGTLIEVPSLGFGAKWRKARRLLTVLARARREQPDLEQENRLWRSLFIECQSRLGYTKRECRLLLDGPFGYPQRHDYEQLLLFGEAPRDAHGLKKNTPTGAPPKPPASSWPSRWRAPISSVAAWFRRESLPRPTSISSGKETAKPNGWPAASPFWTRRSRPPTPQPPSPCFTFSE